MFKFFFKKAQALSIPWESYLGKRDAKPKTSKEVLFFFSQLTKRRIKAAFLADKALVSVRLQRVRTLPGCPSPWCPGCTDAGQTSGFGPKGRDGVTAPSRERCFLPTSSAPRPFPTNPVFNRTILWGQKAGKWLKPAQQFGVIGVKM